MPDPLTRRGPGSQNLSGVAARPGEVVVEEVDRGGGDGPTWMQGLESVMEEGGKVLLLRPSRETSGRRVSLVSIPASQPRPDMA